MKKLIVMRHGKSSWDYAHLDDHDRPLNERGKKNTAKMGVYLLQKTGKPELILSSSAERAYATAVIAAENMGYPKEQIVTDKELYLAWVEEILQCLSRVPNTVSYCLIVGHNPGLTLLINHFGVALDNLPTASTACFEFDTQVWKDISPENARFKWLKQAKEIEMRDSGDIRE